MVAVDLFSTSISTKPFLILIYSWFILYIVTLNSTNFRWKIESLEEEDEELFVFKLGNHVDICDGPLINNSSQIGKFAVTKVRCRISFFLHFFMFFKILRIGFFHRRIGPF